MTQRKGNRNTAIEEKISTGGRGTGKRRRIRGIPIRAHAPEIEGADNNNNSEILERESEKRESRR